MGIFDGLEKLINEHGSAVILKERIALANDKYAALETENKILRAEKDALRLNLEKAETELQNLKKLTDKSHSERLEEIKENLLELLGKHPDVTDEQLSKGMGINIQLVKFHLTELEKKKFVHGSYSVMDETEWSLAHEGRGYLVRHGLLS